MKDATAVLIARVGLDVREDTSISPAAEKRRQEGVYQPPGVCTAGDGSQP